MSTNTFLYLSNVKEEVLETLETLLPENDTGAGQLNRIMLEYPRRGGKALRPAICLATYRALGGDPYALLPTAAALELFHNAALVHDDIEDASLYRRGEPTLHRKYGRPIAVNVGDAMLASMLEPLLNNTNTIGLGRTLKILRIVSKMTRISVEGQMIELRWIRENRWNLLKQDYLQMVRKKTAWYSFIGPTLIGATAAGVQPEHVRSIVKYAALIGMAFQIQDDIINLTVSDRTSGKEIMGDLWEGKRTLILIESLKRGSDLERQKAIRILELDRPTTDEINGVTRTQADVYDLMELIKKTEALGYAQRVATKLASRAQGYCSIFAEHLNPSVHLDFLAALPGYVTERRL